MRALLRAGFVSASHHPVCVRTRERRTAAFFIRYRSRQRRRDPRCDRGPEFRRKSGVHGDDRRGRQLSFSCVDGGQFRADVLDARVRDDLAHSHADERHAGNRRRHVGWARVDDTDGDRVGREGNRNSTARRQRRSSGAGELDSAGTHSAAGLQHRRRSAAERVWCPGCPLVRSIRAVHHSWVQRSRSRLLQRRPAGRHAHGRQSLCHADQQHPERRGAEGTELRALRPWRGGRHDQHRQKEAAGGARVRLQLSRGTIQHASDYWWSDGCRWWQREIPLSTGFESRAQRRLA